MIGLCGRFVVARRRTEEGFMHTRRFRVLVSTLFVSLLLGPAVVAAQEATPASDLTANKALVAQVYESFTAGNLDTLDAIVAPDIVDHFPLAPGQAPGWAGLKTTFAGLRVAFPDINCQAEELIAEGDRVTVLELCTGTQQGAFLGIPPTNRPVTVRSIDIWRVEGGQLVEYWNLVDVLDMLTQLGIVPAFGAAATPAAVATPDSMAVATAPMVATPMTADLEANKEVVRRFFAAFAAPDPTRLEEVLAPDLVHHSAPQGFPPGREGVQQIALAFEAGIPDYQITVEDQIAEGDFVASRATLTGTHTGPFLGIPPTGRPFSVPAIFVNRVVGGQIVDHWEVIDEFGILVQVGLLPAPSAPTGTPPS